MSSSPAGTRVFETPAELRYPGHESTPATVRLRRRDRRDRVAAVAKTWALCWLAAIAAVFLPLLHFVLVPALLIGGPFFALAQLHEHTTLLRATGPCPACAAPVVHAVRARAVPVTRLRCDACGRALELVIADAVLADDAGG